MPPIRLQFLRVPKRERGVRLLMPLALIGMIAWFPASLLAQKVSTEYDKSVDFSTFKTYGWVQGTPTPDPRVDHYIKMVVDGFLQQKGMKAVDPKDANVLITYHAAGSTDLNISGFEDPTYITTGGVPMPGQTVWSSTSTAGSAARLIRKGSLSFQILDRSVHKVVWTGTAKGTLKEKRSEQSEQLDKCLIKIFERYPPAHK